MNIFTIIKTNVSIIDVIGQHVTLKKAGTYWKGSCPFHSEKTASFTVSPHREIFYCFGCQETGDVITFISKIEHCSQFEAAQVLADRYNIELPKDALPEQIESVDEKKRYFALCAVVAQWCHAQLSHHQEVLSYLTQRGITQQDIQSFTLGYFPQGQTGIKQLIEAVLQENFLLKDLITAGIITEGKVRYSSFEGRIMFPIKDGRGNFCGFGGRIFKAHDERSKYYNSPENSFFQKGSLLFGFDLAKREIQTKNTVFLVEGYTDCIAMHRHGYKNTVATLGTACTLEHLKVISHYAHTLYVMYDGDKAGQKAMLRLVELCWQVNLEMNIITLPKETDPAAFLQKEQSITPLIDEAKNIFDFFLHHLQQEFTQAPLQQKLTLARHFLEIIKKLHDPLKEEILLQKASTAFGLPLTSLQKEYAHTIEKKQDIFKPNELKELHSDISSLEKKFLCGILNNTELLKKSSVTRLIPYLPKEFQRLIEKLVCIEETTTESERFLAFTETLDQDEKRLINQILVTETDTTQEHFENIELFLEKKYWKMIVHDTKLQIQQAQQKEDPHAVQIIIDSFLDLKKKLLHKGLI